ncbi:hypothetical protein BJ956_000882 [Arthrobacter psychrochitiniphilus]|nr:hypothetical protein [Arthrobacter psychrochitiniphilus]
MSVSRVTFPSFAQGNIGSRKPLPPSMAGPADQVKDGYMLLLLASWRAPVSPGAILLKAEVRPAQ